MITPLTSKRRSCATTMSRSGAVAPSRASCTYTVAPSQRVLAQAGLPRIGPVLRPSQIDAYLPFIHETLKKFPSLTASRLYAMVLSAATAARPHHFRHLVSPVIGRARRPRLLPILAELSLGRAFMSTRTFPRRSVQMRYCGCWRSPERISHRPASATMPS